MRTIITAPEVPFRPFDCPRCLHFHLNSGRCEGWAIDGLITPMLALFSGSSTKPCPRSSIIACQLPHYQADMIVTHKDPEVRWQWLILQFKAKDPPEQTLLLRFLDDSKSLNRLAAFCLILKG